jgi:hypothetical protein
MNSIRLKDKPASWTTLARSNTVHISSGYLETIDDDVVRIAQQVGYIARSRATDRRLRIVNGKRQPPRMPSRISCRQSFRCERYPFSPSLRSPQSGRLRAILRSDPSSFLLAVRSCVTARRHWFEIDRRFATEATAESPQDLLERILSTLALSVQTLKIPCVER